MTAPSPPIPPRSHPSASRRLFEAVREGIYVGTLSHVHVTPGKTLAANPSLKRILGFPSDTPNRLFEPFAIDRFVDSHAHRSFFTRLLQVGDVTDQLLQLRRQNLEPILVEVTARASTVARGETVRVEALVRDVSERRRLEDHARELSEQLMHAEKLAALGQALSGVAHELNNPLATILGWAERLVERTPDVATRRGLEVILGESERAARIVRNLLAFARNRLSTRAVVDLNQIAADTLALRADQHRARGIGVELALAPALPGVFADAHQLQQVLLNLVINAEHAMFASHGRGLLAVRTRHDAGRGSVVVEVQDDGPGIPDEIRPRVFDPFFTTKPAGQGTGLGLTVAHAIIQDHGGRICLDNRVSGGASFTIELPVGPHPPPPLPGAAHRGVNAGTSVLLAGDGHLLADAIGEA